MSNKTDLTKDRQRSTKEMICPYCGEKYEPIDYELYDESLCEFECSTCNKKFNVRVTTTWLWETSQMDINIFNRGYFIPPEGIK